MPIQDLELFKHLVATGSMCKAARAFGVSPAQVSKQISALEDRLATQLFYRPKARLELTASGRAFYANTILPMVGRFPRPNAICTPANDDAVRIIFRQTVDS